MTDTRETELQAEYSAAVSRAIEAEKTLCQSRIAELCRAAGWAVVTPAPKVSESISAVSAAREEVKLLRDRLARFRQFRTEFSV